MIDAMSMKQMITYDQRSQSLTGYVDIGIGPEEDAEAKEVLVFMLVGLRARWKAPVAFFFTRGLQAEVQTQLVKNCLEKLHDLGFSIDAITMDGHATNIAMTKMLGSNLDIDSEQFQPYFVFPDGHKTFVILDACHMVKLVRNMLEALNIIHSPAGPIAWQLIKDLNKLQEEAGVRLGNKISANHVFFKNQKMKVSLAVQVLSASVACALETLQGMNVPQFSYAGPTVEFIKAICHNYTKL